MTSEHYDWSVAKFTDKERLFVLFYVSDGNRNKSKAAIQAGYSEHSANKAGHNVSIRPHVKAAIDWYLERVQDKALVSAERVLTELSHVAFLDPRKFFDKQNNLLQIHELDESTARALAGFEVTDIDRGKGDQTYTETIKKIKHGDKIKALELIGKYLKMFVDRVEISDRPLVVVKDLSGRKKTEKSE